MIPGSAPAWLVDGCARWAIATCSWWKEGWRRSCTTARERLPVPELGVPVPTIDVSGSVALLDSGDGTVVVDLARSIDFREGPSPARFGASARDWQCWRRSLQARNMW